MPTFEYDGGRLNFSIDELVTYLKQVCHYNSEEVAKGLSSLIYGDKFFYQYICNFVCDKCGYLKLSDVFADFITKEFRNELSRSKSILDIAGGKTGLLSKKLLELEYNPILIDPEFKYYCGFEFISKCFNYNDPISCFNPAIIVGECPCEATEHIIRSAIINHISFAIVLCCDVHGNISGRTFSSYEDWVNYLMSYNKNIKRISISSKFHKSHVLLYAHF